MPILAEAGRKSLISRLIILLIYTALAVGGVTMVVPFIMTIGDSFRTPGDDDEHSLFPRFFFQDAWLYRKYVCVKHGTLSGYRTHTGTDFAEARQIPFLPVQAGDKERAADYYAWMAARVKEDPACFYALFRSDGGANRIQMWTVADRYIAFLRQRHKTIDAVNAAYGTSFSSFDNVFHAREQTDITTWAVRPRFRYFWEWQEFKRTLPADALFPVSMDYRYQLFLRSTLESLAAINASLGTAYESVEAIRLPSSAPANEEHRKLWVKFVADRLPPRFFDWGEKNQAAWQAFLAKRFGSVETYLQYRARETAKAKMMAEESVPLMPREPSGIRSVDLLFGEFVRSLGPGTIQLRLPEVLFADRLRGQYATIGKLNEAYRANYADFGEVPYPVVAADRISFEEQKGAIFRELVRRNYRIVLNYIVFNGRSAWVTLLLCLASIVTALTVNPLAAYALSRYDLKIGYQVLIFFLATMAFPAEVSMIPNFLMLKEMGMLNTLWALFLPGAASGFSIFLLKGFFDALPKELFEAAELDGAGELTIFWRLVLPCSKPVLAVIALGAFTGAYGSFMWAFVVCQDPDWWTIMVYMFKLNNSGVHAGVRVAALVVTSLPTFLVFISCQNLILRGIVVPQMK